VSKETYYVSKETYYVSKETYLMCSGRNERAERELATVVTH